MAREHAVGRDAPWLRTQMEKEKNLSWGVSDDTNQLEFPAAISLMARCKHATEGLPAQSRGHGTRKIEDGLLIVVQADGLAAGAGAHRLHDGRPAGRIIGYR